MEDHHSEYYLSMRQMLLRGSVVANTSFIYGAVVYTGRDTKIMLNSGNYHFKQSKTERMINITLLIQVAILLVLITWMGFMNYYFTTNNTGAWYLFEGVSDYQLFAFKASLSYYLLFNQLLPLALVIVMEIGKLAHTLFIESDAEMFSIDQG